MELNDLRRTMHEGALALTASCVSEDWGTPLIPMAQELGLRVSLQLYRQSAGRGVTTGGQEGVLNFSQPPEIVLFRSTKQSFKKNLSAEDEENLTVRERFSLAHEIAHWYAFKQFGIDPEEPGTPDYWRHEKIMNDFAGVLLVPEKLLDKWVNAIDGGGIANIHHVSRWSRDANVSFSALVTRVVERQPGTGFLKLAVGEEKATKKLQRAPRPILEVLPEAVGNGIALPNNFAPIRNDRLIEKLRGSKKGYEKWMPSISFDNKKIQNLYLWWLQTNFFKGEKFRHLNEIEDVYWTSWAERDLIEASPKKETPPSI